MWNVFAFGLSCTWPRTSGETSPLLSVALRQGLKNWTDVKTKLSVQPSVTLCTSSLEPGRAYQTVREICFFHCQNFSSLLRHCLSTTGKITVVSLIVWGTQQAAVADAIRKCSPTEVQGEIWMLQIICKRSYHFLKHVNSHSACWCIGADTGEHYCPPVK